MAKIVLPTITSGFQSASQLSAGFDAIEAELQNKVLYRDNPDGEPNVMQNDIDLNNNDLLNVGTINAANIAIEGTDLQAQVDAAAASAAAAALSADAFDDVYLGSKAVAPIVDNDGDPLEAGMLYFNTTDNNTYVYTGTVWQTTSLTEADFVTKTGLTGSAELPVGTEAQRDGTPLSGYLRFNTDVNQFEGYNGTAWGSIGGGATGSAGDQVFQENERVVTADYTLSTNKSAMSVGEVTINTGVTVTIPSGEKWVVL